MGFRRLNRQNTANRTAADKKEKSLDSALKLNTTNLREILQPNSDVVFREFFMDGDRKIQVNMVYIDGLINTKQVDDDILKPLIQQAQLNPQPNAGKLLEQIEQGSIYHVSQKTRDNLEGCLEDILDGSAALIFDMMGKAVTFDVKGFEARSISEPTGENVIKGAKDAFVENIRTNTATLRRKIRSHRLTIEETTVGKQSKTKVAIVYMKGITNMHILDV